MKYLKSVLNSHKVLNEKFNKQKYFEELLFIFICQTFQNCFMTIAQLQFIQNIFINNTNKEQNIFPEHEHNKYKHCEYLLVHEKTELSVGRNLKTLQNFRFTIYLKMYTSEYFTVEELADVVVLGVGSFPIPFHLMLAAGNWLFSTKSIQQCCIFICVH